MPTQGNTIPAHANTSPDMPAHSWTTVAPPPKNRKPLCDRYLHRLTRPAFAFWAEAWSGDHAKTWEIAERSWRPGSLVKRREPSEVAGLGRHFPICGAIGRGIGRISRRFFVGRGIRPFAGRRSRHGPVARLGRGGRRLGPCSGRSLLHRTVVVTRRGARRIPARLRWRRRDGVVLRRHGPVLERGFRQGLTGRGRISAGRGPCRLKDRHRVVEL